MEKQLDRIERKLEEIDVKLSGHVERIARIESSHGWIKFSLAFIISALGTIVAVIAKFNI